MMFGNENSSGMGFTLFCVIIMGLVFGTVFNGMLTGEMDLSLINRIILAVGL